MLSFSLLDYIADVAESAEEKPEPAFDVAEPIVRYVTIGVVAALVVLGLILFLTKKCNMQKYLTYAITGFLFYALVQGIMMVCLKIAKYSSPNYLEENELSSDVFGYVLIPLICLFALILLCGFISFFLKRGGMQPKPFKISLACMGGVILAGAIACAVLISLYYFKHIANDGYYNSKTASVNQVALYVSVGVLIVVLLIGAFVLGAKDKTPFDTHCIALAGITVAMSFALSYIKLWAMPQGGTVTLVSLLPVMIFAYVYGPKKGILVGLIYGLLQAVQDPWIIHPAQFILDYPVAFAMVGFSGVFKRLPVPDRFHSSVTFALGAVVCAALRFISHVLSGVFAFSTYAGESNVWIYSLAYNSFVFIDMALVIVVGVLVFASRSFNKQIEHFTKVQA